MLPGIDGYQVCREVRASSDIPVIMLSPKERSLTRSWDLSWEQTIIWKALDSKELVARVKVLRRYKTKGSAQNRQLTKSSLILIRPSI